MVYFSWRKALNSLAVTIIITPGDKTELRRLLIRDSISLSEKPRILSRIHIEHLFNIAKNLKKIIL